MLVDAVNNVPSQPLTQPEPEHEVMTVQQHFWFKVKGYFNLFFHKVVLLLLMGNSVIGLYEATHFMLIDFPILEEKFMLKEVTVMELNETIAEPLISLIGTSLMIILIIRMSIVKEEVAEMIDTILALSFVIFGRYLVDYLVSLHFIDISFLLK